MLDGAADVLHASEEVRRVFLESLSQTGAGVRLPHPAPLCYRDRCRFVLTS